MSDLEALLHELNVDMTTVSPEGLCLAFKTNGANALNLWRSLRAKTETTGHWPVMLGPENELTAVELAETRAEAEPLLQSGLTLSASDWLATRLKQSESDMDSLAGEWPDAHPPSGESYMIPVNMLTGTPHTDLVMALVPTANSFEVPAFLKYGGWNDCPDTYEHIAILKYWHEKYGAEVVGMSHDVIECVVSKPPQTREAALELAREQYAYCGDIVWQGTETIESLAGSILNSPQWYFWWD